MLPAVGEGVEPGLRVPGGCSDGRAAPLRLKLPIQHPQVLFQLLDSIGQHLIFGLRVQEVQAFQLSVQLRLPVFQQTDDALRFAPAVFYVIYLFL